MLDTYRKLYRLLTPRERRWLGLVFLGVMGRALLEVVGVASIIPFLSVVGNPDIVQKNAILNWFYTTLGFTSVNSFLLFLGFLALALLVSTNTFAAVVHWALYRFSWMRNHSLARRLLAGYLQRPYVFFLGQNSAILGRNILAEVQHLTNGILVPGLQLLASIAVVLCLVTLLLVVNPLLATLVILAAGGAYGAVYLLVRHTLRRLGRVRIDANRERFKIVGEAFGSIKMLKLVGQEHQMLNTFSRASHRFSSAMASQQVISLIPRYLMEVVAFGGLLIVVLYLLATGQNLAQVLPLMGLYAFASYRLLPALQNTFSGAAQLRFNQAALDAIYEDLQAVVEEPPAAQAGSLEPLHLREALELRSVTFRYPSTKEPVISNLNLAVAVGRSIALVGETGAGKTTVADLILGLLRPDTGALLVDGQELVDELLPRWQRNLGYVPQDIYLTDDTVARNIAFGVPEREMDMRAMVRAARIANIHDFIAGKLPQGYDTMVGERGVSLSGGERQRIGIARALYHDPQVLVLDEATSALDGATEAAVFQAIKNVARAKTLIIIAHRLATVKDCDVVYLLEHGRIVAEGRYEDLLATNAQFRQMAKVNT
jgi:ABC-type multidrug transport system fused ATPase/permease subunit